MTDIIADSLTRIRNAAMRRLDTTTLLHSKAIEAIVSILVDKGYLESFSVKDLGNNKKVIISKPGRRIYKGKDDIKSFKNGYGTLIVSTSNGILPNDEAFKRGIGGEIICSVW